MLIPIFLYVINTAKAQAIEWAKTIDVAPANSWINGRNLPHITFDGTDVITTGFVSRTVTLGTNTYTANAGVSGYLAKLDNTGQVLWSKHLVGALNTLKTVSDANKNIFVLGFYADSIFTDNLIFTNSTQQPKLFLAKFSPNGTLLWAKTSASGIDSGNHIDLTTDGANNIYFSIEYTSSFSIENATVTSMGNTDIAIVKYSQNGSFHWLKNFGSNQIDWLSSISGGLTDNFYFSASTINAGNGQGNYFIKKFNGSGAEVWSETIPVINAHSPNLVIDAHEDVYFACRLDTSITINNTTKMVKRPQ